MILESLAPTIPPTRIERSSTINGSVNCLERLMRFGITPEVNTQ